MRRLLALSVLIVVVALSWPASTASSGPTIDQFLSPAYPQELTSARHADRIAWWSYERGRRDVYTAAAPDFRPVRLTNFADDNGVEISDLQISDDGSIVAFMRGTQPNRDGWVANPTQNPRGADRTIWAARTAGGAPWKIGEGTSPEPSPDGMSVVFAKGGQIYRNAVAAAAAGSARTKSETPFIRAWGTNGAGLKWSPDGTHIAFVSDRVDHSFIGVYDVRTRELKFLSPSVDHDTSPTWSP